MDQEGQVLRSGRVPNLDSEIENFLEGGEAMEAVIEKGRSSCTMVDVLEELGVAMEIADLNRFSDAAHLHAYAGVIPSTHSSGDKTHHEKIIKAGNRWLRWAVHEDGGEGGPPANNPFSPN